MVAKDMVCEGGVPRGGSSAEFTPAYTPEQISAALRKGRIRYILLSVSMLALIYLGTALFRAGDIGMFDFTLNWYYRLIFALAGVVLVFGSRPASKMQRAEMEDTVKCSKCTGVHSLKEINARRSRQKDRCGACLHVSTR